MSEAAEPENQGNEEAPKNEAPGQLELFLEANRKQGEELNQSFDRLTQEIRRSNQKPPEKPVENPQPVYTAAQLKPLIESGEIDAIQAAEYLAETKIAKLREEMRKELEEKLESQGRQTTVQSKLQSYQDAIPELADRSSESYKKLDREYQLLVSEDRKPRNEETLLEAMRLAFGRNPGKAQPRETTAERQRTSERSGSGGGRGASERKPSGDGWPDFLPAQNKAWYEKQIERGVYKSLKDPKLQKEFSIIKRKLDEKESAA